MKKEPKAMIRTPVKDLKKSDSIEHYNAVLLEDIKSKMEQVIEVTETTKESIHKEMNEFREEVNQRFDMVESVVRAHSGQLQNIEITLAGHGRQLTDHGKQLTDHGKQLTDHGKQLTDHGKQLTDHGKQLTEINKHVTEHDTRFDKLETDVKEIKVTVKRLDEKMSDDHEERIAALEKSLTAHA